MFDVKIDRPGALVEFVLKGDVTPAEMDRFVSDFRRACEILRGKDFLIQGDVRGFNPTASEVVEKQSAAYQLAIDHGVQRFAEIVDSDVVAREVNRLARESGTDQLLRRFWDAESAQKWLQSGGESPA